jgi:hypothetical protein
MREFLRSATAWLKDYESLAIWLEGIALVAILILDWRERIDQRQERQDQHNETAAQMEISRRQVDAATKSADVAVEAALASKKSAEILAALHRPFMGLLAVSLKSGGHGFDLWSIDFVLKNFGTLPALNMGITIEFFAGDTSFAKEEEPTSLEVFPSTEPNVITHQVIHRRVDIQNGVETLRMDVRIPYQAEDGRQFNYTARVFYNHKRNGFDIERSETHLVGTVTTTPIKG